jgi:hypothetical protein
MLLAHPTIRINQATTEPQTKNEFILKGHQVAKWHHCEVRKVVVILVMCATRQETYLII